VFPFAKFPGVDPILGPEMKSTGEVMGVGLTFGEAFAKAQAGAGELLPSGGVAFLSVRDPDKAGAVEVARALIGLGFSLTATRGTAAALKAAGLAVEQTNKVGEGRPHIVDRLKNGEISFIVNTTEGRQAIADSATIRRYALLNRVHYTTTLAGAEAICQALQFKGDLAVHTLQALHERLK
jgi:carbamoyl-phosphate synthase large subunit